MASFRTEILIDARLEDAWAALRDWGALHQRLVPGFVVDARLDDGDRIVEFFDGTIVRETLVDLDERDHRLVWSVVGGPYTHHNGAAQVFAEGPDRTRFVWVADFLPHELADQTGALMKQGTDIVKETLEARAAPA
jgi:Polyketide cyclase / dehydrase and lipid transport